VALADLSSFATGHVYVNVVSNVAVGVVTANVNLGNVQNGIFPGTLIFRVDANVEALDLTVTATNLYKGDSAVIAVDQPDGTVALEPNPYVIPLVTSAGAAIAMASGNEVAGGDNIVPFDGGTPASINGLPGTQSLAGRFESSQGGHFSQPVNVTVRWNQGDPELPVGEYSGFVMLTAAVPPVVPPTPPTGG